MIETLTNLFKLSRSGIFKWKKENRPIINLINEYFSEEDIKEYLETGQITKFKTNNLYHKSIERKFNTLLEEIRETLDFEGIHLLFNFLDKYKLDLLNNINSFNPLLNFGRVPRYNVFLLKKLMEYKEEKKDIKELNLEEDFAQFSIYLIEIPYDLKLFIYQSFYTDFKYIKSKELKMIYQEFKNNHLFK
ncbi:MAG: hypothetical protein DI567_02020 [Aliarcobacter butzleri]|nr:MAG: hypothetical protein DI567_02020 [Aliarcobacter butzleri]